MSRHGVGQTCTGFWSEAVGRWGRGGRRGVAQFGIVIGLVINLVIGIAPAFVAVQSLQEQSLSVQQNRVTIDQRLVRFCWLRI